MEVDKLTEQVIGLAIEVHRHLGPGLLESAYQECLYYELKNANLKVEREKKLHKIFLVVFTAKNKRRIFIQSSIERI